LTDSFGYGRGHTLNSNFLWHALPDGVKLCHKMGKGYVDLAIRGAGNELEEFKQEYESRLEEGMYIESSAKVIK